MSFGLLEILIRAACATGDVSEKQLAYLQEQAKILGVSGDNLNFLIESELERVRLVRTQKEENLTKNRISAQSGETDSLSGFVLENEDNLQSGFTTDNEELNSGFVTDNKGVQTNFIRRQSTFSEVKNLSAQGAMSLIQKGKYFNKWVVIKRLKPKHRKSKNYRNLFFKEFENAYFFDHPHIVRINGKGEDAQGLYYFMEFIDGRPLTMEISEIGVKDGSLVKKVMMDASRSMLISVEMTSGS